MTRKSDPKSSQKSLLYWPPAGCNPKSFEKAPFQEAAAAYKLLLEHLEAAAKINFRKHLPKESVATRQDDEHNITKPFSSGKAPSSKKTLKAADVRKKH